MELPIGDIRTNVAARIKGGHESVVPDILDSSKTHDNIIRALDRITAPAHKGGHGRAVLVTSARTNHHDDGHLGPHGHNPHGGAGWSIDFVPCSDDALSNSAETVSLLRELISKNRYITKVGCPARYATLPELLTLADSCHTVLFTDEGTGPHIHIQSA